MKKALSLALSSSLLLSLSACSSETEPMLNTRTISTQLVEVLNQPVEAGDFVIFKAKNDKNYYVQATEVEESEMILEAVSDTYLSHSEELTQDQVDSLMELGWQEPDEGGNYFMMLSSDDVQDLSNEAALIEQTLREVYQLEDIEIERGNA